MSTRSIISKKEGNKYLASYCHWDGYFEYNGKMLMCYYNSEKKAKELIELGSLSSIRERIKPNVNETHNFEKPLDDVTIAFHRDRQEDYEPPVGSDNLNDIISIFDDCEFIYVYDGRWYGSDITDGKFNLVKLTKEICKCEEIENKEEEPEMENMKHFEIDLYPERNLPWFAVVYKSECEIQEYIIKAKTKIEAIGAFVMENEFATYSEIQSIIEL